MAVEGWYGLMSPYNPPIPLSTLCVRGCEGLTWEDEEAFPPSVFWYLSAFVQVNVPLQRIDDYRAVPIGCRFLLLEISSCSQLRPFIGSITTLLRSHPFERIFLVSHTACALGSCLLPSFLNALESFNSLTIWGTHLSDQILRLTFTVTYACSYIETYNAHHTPPEDLSFLQALSDLHLKLYPGSTYLSHLPLWDFQLRSLDLVSLNLTDCEAVTDAIHAWLSSIVLEALNLQSIVLSNNAIDDDGASKIIAALRLHENSKLRILDLSHNNITSDGFTCLASALSVNTALSQLNVSGNPTYPQPWGTLITVLFTMNRTIEKLQVDGRPAKEASVQPLCDLIKTNTVLKHLQIRASRSFEQSDVLAIFRALEENKSLTSFALPGCNAVDGVEVYEAIVDAIVSNDQLENLDLRETPIMQNPKLSSMISGLLQRHDDNKQQSCLRHVPKVQPSTSRVFLCGEGLAGKTTFCGTMTRVLKSWHERYLKDGSNVLKTKVFGQAPRTKGIQVTHLECDKISLSLWDLAGQHEYHAFHDLMFPLELGPSLFLIVCSLMVNSGRDRKSDADIKREVDYWLSYISSNTRKLKNKIPNVILIFSHKDKLPTNYPIDNHIQKLASQWRTDYKDFTRVLDKIFIINGRNKADVKDVAQYVFEVSENLLAQCPPIYDFCNKLRHRIDAWNLEHPGEPWLQTSEFFGLVRQELREIMDTLPEPVTTHGVEELTKAVCCCLHDSGHVIFFEEVSMVFLNPGWFCEQFMGGIIDRATKSLDFLEHSREGDAWNRKGVEKMLESAWKSWNGGFSSSRALKKKTSKEFSISDLVQILLKLDFCYELDPGNPDSSLFIPSALQHSYHSGPQRWDSDMQGACTYLGRRLKCEDEKHTFLTPGFFPALQVHLRKAFPFPALYRVVRNVIKIYVDGMEILIELCEKPITFIDILARSCKSSSQTILFLREHLIESIQRLQGVTGHWQGIDLVEGIVRPLCVKRLTLCTARLDQFVLVDDLRKILLNTVPMDIEELMFAWPDSPDLNIAVEHLSIKELLGEEDFSRVLGKVLTQITHFSKELNLSVTPINTMREAPTPTWNRSLSDLSTNSVEKHVYSLAVDVRSMVNEIKVDVKDLKRAVGDLVKKGKELAPQIQNKLSELLMSSRETRLPRLFVLMKGEKLITRFTPGLSSLNLQFMCEHEGGLHVPLEQPGYDITIVENDTLGKILPYLKYLLSAIVLGLKVGAHVVGGMADLVPDLSTSMDEVIQATGLAAEAVISLKSPDEVLKGLAPGGPLTAYSGKTDRKFLIARAWVEEFLENKGCVKPFQIFKMFGLVKTKLVDGRILWLCEKHIDDSCNQVDWHS